MKTLKKAFLPMLGLGLLASCSNDNLDGPNVEDAPIVDGITVMLNITQLPTTRTATGSTGEEYGQDYESKIQNAIVILANTSDNTVISSTVLDVTEADRTEIKKKEAKFDKDEVYAFLDASTQKDVNVFVVCNYDVAKYAKPSKGMPIQDVLDIVAASDIDTYADVTNSKFLMSGVNTLKNQTTANLTRQKTGEGGTTEQVWDLGTVQVRRAMARFDIKVKNNTITNGNSNQNITYSVDGVALVNLNKSFNLFQEVGEVTTNGAKASAWTFFGEESAPDATPEIFVYDPFWSNKRTLVDGDNDEGTTSNYSDFFIYPVNGIGSSTQFTPISELTAWTNEDKGIKTDADKQITQTDYAKWTYVVPNTIHEKDRQRNGVSTGVYFRVKFVPTAGEGQTFTDGDNLYGLDGVLVGNFADVQASGLATVKEAYNKVTKAATEAGVIAADESGKYTETELAEYLGEGFDVYKKTTTGNNQGYFCYYYYWNRHNDNDKNDIMGPMEFGVVRNNVYKLSVTKINGLGSPEPTPGKPDDPDEKSTVICEVSVEVLPWTLRINEIEF